MEIREFLDRADIIPQLFSTDKTQALRELSRRASAALGIPQETILGAITAREKLGSTGLGQGFALPHARILLHQPWGGVEGQASDIELQAKEILRMRDLLTSMLAEDTGQTHEKVTKDTDRDFIMTADEAVTYGVIDEIITSRTVAPLEAIGAA